MKGKTLLILLIVAGVAGGAGYWLLGQREEAFSSGGGRLGRQLLEFSINDIQRARIQDAGSSVTLTYTNDMWRVEERWGYPAAFAEISKMAQTLADLKALDDVKVGPSQLGRLQLISPASQGDADPEQVGTLVEFFDENGKLLESLLLGKQVMDESQNSQNSQFGGSFPIGRYVMDDSQSGAAWRIGVPLNDINPDPQEWIDKEFLKVQKPRRVSVMATNETSSWTVLRETESADWQLADPAGEQLDKSKVSSLNYVLSSPSFTDLVNPAADPAELGLDDPRVAEIETFDGLTYALKIGIPNEENNYPLQIAVSGEIAQERTPSEEETPEDKEAKDAEFAKKKEELTTKLDQEKRLENWTYLVSKWTVDSLLKNRADLLTQEEPPAEETTTGNQPSGNPEAPGFIIPDPLTPQFPPEPEGASSEAAREID